MQGTVTKFIADDGSEWSDAAKAVERDGMIRCVAEAMRPLGERFDGDSCAYQNGNLGYVQHDPERVAEAKRALIEVSQGPLAWWFKSQREEHGRVDFMDVHGSWFGRMLDGSCPPLENAWHRFCTIDERAREWGQPYYASRPDKASNQSCAEDRR